MKKRLLQLVNGILHIAGLKITRSTNQNLTMQSGIRRIKNHDFKINSILDIGASNGKWSIDTMQVFPRASYLAIEPLSERRKELEKLKNKYSNFDYEICVAGKNGGEKITLNVTEDLDGSTVNGTNGEKRDVTVDTVDNIIAINKLEGPFLLKFDTHGFEIPILHGAKETLGNTNIIIMEVYNFNISKHAERFHEMCTRMENLGFRCYDIANPMLRDYDNAFWQMDLFFCRKDSNIFDYNQYK